MHTTVITLQAAQAGNANGTAAQVAEYPAIGVQVVGSGFTGTVNFEGSIDGANWAAVPLQKSDGTWVSTATATGMFQTNAAIWAQFRARTSSVTGGTVTVTLLGIH
jgi:hypothetical protein